MFHLMGFFIFCAAFYFLPSIIGWQKHNAAAIIAVNVLLGWTVVGWIVALIWALSTPGPTPFGNWPSSWTPGPQPTPGPSPYTPPYTPPPYSPPPPIPSPQPGPGPQAPSSGTRAGFCSHCGAALRAGDKFCGGCGAGVPGA